MLKKGCLPNSAKISIVTGFMLGLKLKIWKNHIFITGNQEKSENFLKSLWKLYKNGFISSPEKSGEIFPTILAEIFDAKF